MRLTIRTILSIFALSMFLSCQEDTNSGLRQCGDMIISDALPLQWWLSGCDTFNEHVAGGVHPVCWCQPWNCDDEILDQFTDTPGQTFYLIAVDADGNVLFNIPYSEVQSGVYQIAFTPSDEDICDQTISLKTLNDNLVAIIAPSLWTNDGGAFDTKSATQFIEAFTTSTGLITVYQSAVIPTNTTVTYRITVTVSGSWSGGEIAISTTLQDALSNGVVDPGAPGTVQQLEIFSNGTYEVDFVMTTNAESAKLVLFMGEFINSGSGSVTITMPVGDILYFNSAIEKKTDCLEIAESHDETIFIEYSNQTNFAGLVYENDSPDTTFGIRVPSRFFHEVEPEEDEAMELTSSVIITSAQVKTQRLLEVKHAPYYFHKKLRRVLKHQTITIFDKQWKKEEKYEVIEGKKTWPLKAATCLLTEKDSVVRNVS